MLTNGHYSRVNAPRGVGRPQRIERTQRILPYEAHNRSLTRRFFDEGDQHEVDQEWEEDVENTRAAEDPERRFSSFDRVPKRHGPRRIAAAAFLLVGAGFLWHYRQGVREVVSSRLFHEPTGGSMTAAAAGDQAVPAAPATPRSVSPEGQLNQPAGSTRAGTAAFDQGPQPIPPPEATAPVPVVPVAAAVPVVAAVPPAEPAESAPLTAPARAKAIADSTPEGGTPRQEAVAAERRPSRPRALEASAAPRPSHAKRGYVWSPSAAALVPTSEAGASGSPASTPSALPPSQPASNDRAGTSSDDTLAPSLTSGSTPSAAASTAPKEAPPAATERRSEEPPPKTIASPSLTSPPVIAPPPAAPEPEERPVGPTEPPPFK